MNDIQVTLSVMDKDFSFMIGKNAIKFITEKIVNSGLSVETIRAIVKHSTPGYENVHLHSLNYDPMHYITNYHRINNIYTYEPSIDFISKLLLNVK
jgi:hypothetical protein